MIADGVLFPLQGSELYTDEKGGSYWLTPIAKDASHNGESPSNLRINRPGLPCVVKMIATPTASQASKPVRKPSPSTVNGTHGETIQDSIGRLNPEMIGKKLSVKFVESMMGYQTGWTDLNPLEIQ